MKNLNAKDLDLLKKLIKSIQVIIFHILLCCTFSFLLAGFILIKLLPILFMIQIAFENINTTSYFILDLQSFIFYIAGTQERLALHGTR